MMTMQVSVNTPVPKITHAVTQFQICNLTEKDFTVALLFIISYIFAATFQNSRLI